mgnify:FL=1
MREEKDGWHVISGYPVLVKDGIVSKVLDLDGMNELAIFAKDMRVKEGAEWEQVNSVRIANFRLRLKSGSIKLVKEA